MSNEELGEVAEIIWKNYMDNLCNKLESDMIVWIIDILGEVRDITCKCGYEFEEDGKIRVYIWTHVVISNKVPDNVLRRIFTGVVCGFGEEVTVWDSDVDSHSVEFQNGKVVLSTESPTLLTLGIHFYITEESMYEICR